MSSSKYSSRLRSSSAIIKMTNTNNKRTLRQAKQEVLECSKSSLDSGFGGDMSRDNSIPLLTPSPPKKRTRLSNENKQRHQKPSDIQSLDKVQTLTNTVLTPILNKDKSRKDYSSADDDKSNKKKVRFYPIFEKNYCPQSLKQSTPSSSMSKRPPRVARRRLPFLASEDQYALDLGQKDFDANRCKVCNMLYTIGEITDEKQHANYHDKFINGLKFNNWKLERTLKYLDDLSRIIAIRPKDPKHMLKKVDDLFVVADLELGINCDLKSSMKDSSLYLLFITPFQRIAGFVAAEKIDHASPLLVSDSSVPLVSDRNVKATIGVSRIWVHPAYRRQGIATALLEILRANFFKDRIEPKRLIAFSDPTLNGKQFAQAYIDRKDILIFQYNAYQHPSQHPQMIPKHP